MRSCIRKFMFCNVVRLSLLHLQNLVLLFKSTLQLVQRLLQLLSKPSTASPVPFICSSSKALYSYSRALNSSKAYAAPENPSTCIPKHYTAHLESFIALPVPSTAPSELSTAHTEPLLLFQSLSLLFQITIVYIAPPEPSNIAPFRALYSSSWTVPSEPFSDHSDASQGPVAAPLYPYIVYTDPPEPSAALRSVIY